MCLHIRPCRKYCKKHQCRFCKNLCLTDLLSFFGGCNISRIYEKNSGPTSLIHTAPSPYLRHLLDLREDELAMVVTDERSVFEEICMAYGIEKSALSPKTKYTSIEIPPDPVDEITTKQGIRLKYYRDDMLSLSALYSLKEGIHSALGERVWLKSGAYLVIQPTEALTVIDVNTGKNISGKDVFEKGQGKKVKIKK